MNNYRAGEGKEDVMSKDYQTVPTDEVIGKLSTARRAKINERADELIAEEFSSLKVRAVLKEKGVSQ
jgi:hypothetical protein